MTTTAEPRSRTSDLTGTVVVEAARRMLPALTARVLAAATDRVLEKVDQLAERLDDVADNGLPERAPRRADAAAADSGQKGGGAGSGPLGAAFSLLVTQARALLDFVVALLARAAAALRTTAERARRTQAPEGIDEEKAALEADDDPEDLDEAEDLDEDDEADEADERETQPTAS